MQGRVDTGPHAMPSCFACLRAYQNTRSSTRQCLQPATAEFTNSPVLCAAAATACCVVASPRRR
jgi:hypothetical protein